MTSLAGYVLEERIAVGGMAEIFRARRQGPAGFAKRVAVKRVLPDLSRDPAFVAMFLEEARLQARLSSANLVQVFDFGEEQGAYFLVMEYVDGVDLAALLAHAGPLPLPVAAHLGRELCQALVDLHAATGDDGAPLNVVHRDVTPANVLLSATGDVKLGDFGVAKARARSQRTARGAIKGKLAYLSPEAARGEELDQRADLYGLGLVLFEATTGERFLLADDEIALLRLAERPRWRSPTSLRPDLPRACEELLTRLLAPEPERRLPNARLAAQLLREALPTVDPTTGREALAALVREARAGADLADADATAPRPTSAPQRERTPTPRPDDADDAHRADAPRARIAPTDRPRTEVLNGTPTRGSTVSPRRVLGGLGVGLAALAGVLALWPSTPIVSPSPSAPPPAGVAVAPNPSHADHAGGPQPAAPPTALEPGALTTALHVRVADRRPTASPASELDSARGTAPADATPPLRPGWSRGAAPGAIHAAGPDAAAAPDPGANPAAVPGASGTAAAGSLPSTPSDLERARAALQAVDASLETRQLLPTDVPDFMARHRLLAAALARGDAPLADIDRLAADVARIRIDRAFIDAKLGRLNKTVSGRPLDDGTRKTLGRRAQVALSLSLQGRYDAANAELNAIAREVEQ